MFILLRQEKEESFDNEPEVNRGHTITVTMMESRCSSCYSESDSERGSQLSCDSDSELCDSPDCSIIVLSTPNKKVKSVIIEEEFGSITSSEENMVNMDFGSSENTAADCNDTSCSENEGQ